MFENVSIFNKVVRVTREEPKVSILMSGKGSNAEVILRNRDKYPNLQFTTIFTDQPGSNAIDIAKRYNLDYAALEFNKGQEDRNEYFQRVAQIFRNQTIDFAIYAGFMRIAPGRFVSEFPGINVHPSDLTIKNENGIPKYRGMDALLMSVREGEEYVASTAYVVEEAVDCGSPIAVSRYVPVTINDLDDIPGLHERLKHKGEHILFPQVLTLLSRGLISVDNTPLSSNEVERLLGD